MQTSSAGQLPRVGEIDGLRAIAMTMVILMHSGLLPFGWMGVWVFYVISGFVVCGAFHNSATKNPADPSFVLRNFFAKRAARIWPIYFAYVILTAIAVYFAYGYLNPGEIFSLFSFTYNFEKAYEFAGPQHQFESWGALWTISVEQQFYLVFPILYFLFIANRTTFRGGIALILAMPVLRVLIAYWGIQHGMDREPAAFAVYVSGFCHLDAFMIGALMARHRDTLAKIRWSDGAFWAAAIGVSALYVGVQIALHALLEGQRGVAMFTNVISGVLYGDLKEVFVYFVPVLFAAAVIASIVKGRAFTRWLGSSPMRFIGQVSFSAYVIHPLFRDLAEVLIHPIATASAPTRLVIFAFIYGTTLAAATLTYHLIEKRVTVASISRWLDLTVHKPKPAAAASARTPRA